MKNFDADLIEQFDTFSISAPNESKNNYHLYADFVELICLVTNDYVSKADVIDRLTDYEVKFQLEYSAPDGETGLRDSEISDVQEKWINIIYDILLHQLSYNNFSSYVL